MKKLNKILVTKNGAMEYLGDDWQEKAYKIEDDIYLIPYNGNLDYYREGIVYGFVIDCLWNAHKLWSKKELTNICETLVSDICFNGDKELYTVRYPSTKKESINFGRSFDSVFKTHCDNTFRDNALWLIEKTLIMANDNNHKNVIVF